LKDQYVILTGGKNNAGDYLIKYRAKKLFAALRPDRTVVDYDGWKPFTQEQLDEINASRALILTGGPALQYNMRPSIYPMVEDLSQIKVPILTMGIGWKSLEGSWESTHEYPLSDKALELLNRCEADGFISSVRDYHTLNVLMSRGYKKFVMTGCPALYSLEHVNTVFPSPTKLTKISFSLGVSFVESQSMEKSMKATILALRDYFADAELNIIFHHSLNDSIYLKMHNARELFLRRHQEFARWLESEKISYVDVSGGVDKFLAHYQSCDFHVGYRVHAHILMTSLSKPTALLCEDGRGIALRDVIGGLVLNGHKYHAPFRSRLRRLINRLVGGHKDVFSAVPTLPNDLISNMDYEIENAYPRISLARKTVDANFELMKTFLRQLP